MVDIGHPHMKWHDAELESQAGDDKHDAKDQHLLLDLARGDGAENDGQIERSGGAIHHRQPVQQETAGQRTQDEVLHRRLAADGAIAAQRNQGVAR